MKTIIWEVKALSPPAAIRHCRKCGMKTYHVSSGSFRVNAQQKSLDIWLVYRCAHCKSTWNLAIYSRVNPKSISATLLGKFMDNDIELAHQYAMDTSFLKKNGAEAEPAPHSITGDTIDFAQDTRVKITSQYPSKQMLSKIIRKKLSLSKKAFDEMVANGTIRLENGADIKKCRVRHGLVVLFHSARPHNAN